MATEPQQIPAGQPAVLPQTTAPPSYYSLQPDQQRQQLPPGQQQQVPVQQLQQGVPFQAWPQGQVCQPVMGGIPQQGPVQYIAVSDHSSWVSKISIRDRLYHNTTFIHISVIAMLYYSQPEDVNHQLDNMITSTLLSMH